MQALTLQKVHAPLTLEERPDPIPEADEVVITLKAAGVNRRDFWITRGLYPGIKVPVVLGSDGAGIVEQTGAGLGNYWQGREVIINPGLNWGPASEVQSGAFHILGLPKDGTFATHVAVPSTQLHPKPEHLNWQQAAALPLAGVTAWRALVTQGKVEAGETVLVTGVGGGVATFVLQFAVALGAKVWVTSSSSDKIEAAIKLGAEGGFDYTAEDWPKQMPQAPSLIIDSAGGSGYRSLIQVAAPGARIVNYGATQGPPEKLDLAKVFWKQLTLRGSTMGSPDDFSVMLSFVEQKRLAPVIDQIYPLADGNSAIESMKSSPQFGKLVLQIAE